MLIAASLTVSILLIYLHSGQKGDYEKVKSGMLETEATEILGTPFYSSRDKVKARRIFTDPEDPDKLIPVTRKCYQLSDHEVGEIEYDANGVAVHKSNRKVVGPSRFQRLVNWMSSLLPWSR
jgi:hypothetical protein